jgi:hypothetical protein
MVHWHVRIDGSADTVVAAPHADGDPHRAATWFADDDPTWRSAWFAEWDESGAGVAADAAARRLGARSISPALPRSVLDMGRPWAGAPGDETLMGKGALDGQTKARLSPDGVARARIAYDGAIAEVRAATSAAHGWIEAHEYGVGGSTYDVARGVRPFRRPEVAVVSEVAPWSTATPTGLACLIPADLRPTPWALRHGVEAQLAARGFRPGPSPYPDAPWSLGARFVAERYLAWRCRVDGVDPQPWRDLAWGDPNAPAPDAVYAAELARRAATLPERLADRFHDEDPCFVLVVELRIDLRARADAFGDAIAEGAAQWQRARRGA